MKKIVLIVGARPNFMKAFPVYEALKNDFELTLIHTGQHFDPVMSDVFFNQLGFPIPNIHLNLESKSRAGDYDNILYIDNIEYLMDKKKVIDELVNIESNKLGQLGEIRDKLIVEFEKIKPNLIMVFGDVTSTLSAGLAGKKLQIEIAHIESGLRSGDLSMPEEVNRILTDYISTYYFVTEPSGVENLKNEGIEQNVYLVGNTMIDCLYMFKDRALETKYYDKIGVEEKEYVLITLHRPANVDDLEKLKEIFDQLIKLSETEKLVYPVHPRTKINLGKIGYLEKIEMNENIILSEPLGYLEFTCLEANAKYVITDSGGIQEETSALGIPCFTLRPNTERPITLIENGGTNQLINNFISLKFKKYKKKEYLNEGVSSIAILSKLIEKMTAKILICFGTRPEYIKVKSLIQNMKNIKSCFTGQHKDLLNNVNVDYKLQINESLTENRLNNIFANILCSSYIFKNIEYVLVQGDTTTALAIAISAFNNGIKIIHLEAGLRSNDIKNPFPEEMNRQEIARLADIHLCPTEFNKKNIEKENTSGQIFVVGNTGLDNIEKDNCEYCDNVLITMHRRDNHDIVKEWFEMFEKIANKYNYINFIIPLHPNPNIQKYSHILKKVKTIEPVKHDEMIKILKKCKFVISDSGGLQEECSFLNKKIIVCRKTTERPESVGKHSIMCKSPEDLEKIVNMIINDYQINEECPYGDGKSWKKIIDNLYYLNVLLCVKRKTNNLIVEIDNFSFQIINPIANKHYQFNYSHDEINLPLTDINLNRIYISEIIDGKKIRLNINDYFISSKILFNKKITNKNYD